MQLSAYLKNILADHVLRGQAWAPPSTVYLALFTGDPTEAGSGPEVAGAGYARVAVVFDGAEEGLCQNSVQLIFAQAQSIWGVITHGALYDAASGGNLLFFGAFVESKSIVTTDQLVLPAGNFVAGFI